MTKLMIEGGATVSGTDYTLRDVTRVATSNTKMTEVFSGSILGGASTTLDVTKVKRYLQISVRTYYNYSTFVIDTAGRETVYGGSTEMAEDSAGSYYTVGVCYNRTTGVFTVNNIGYFQINSTSYTNRNNNGAYCVYKIDTFDETYTDTTDYIMVPKDSTITALTSALNRIETLGQFYYPVGSIYMSVNDVDPSMLFGGTWERIAKGRTLVGEGVVEANTDNWCGNTPAGAWTAYAGLTGGTVSAAHHHWEGVSFDGSNVYVSNYNQVPETRTKSCSRARIAPTNTGTTNTREMTTYDTWIYTMMPYLVVYMWKRIA
jgi:hypothetical protein